MNKFEFSLTREETFNHLYEYIISHSCEFFGVPNIEVTYSIIIDSNNFIMLVFADENKDVVDHLDSDDLAFTDDIYKTIQVKSEQQDFINICHGNVCLNGGEIRYIKFCWKKILNEVGKMFYSMANAFLKLDYHDGKMYYDSKNDKFFYGGLFNKKKCNKRHTIVDISEHMKKCWY